MVAITHEKCSECGKRHAFCLPNAHMFLDKAVYEYVCPTTGNTARLIAPDHWTEAPTRCPRGSVEVWQVGNQH